jgi:hypothetical protein
MSIFAVVPTPKSTALPDSSNWIAGWDFSGEKADAD